MISRARPICLDPTQAEARPLDPFFRGRIAPTRPKTAVHRIRSRASAGLALIVCGALPLVAQNLTPPVDFSALDLGQLSQVKVVSVSNRPELAWRAPSAVFVLSGEDAVRTGADTIPEALRWIPGINVGQINASTWGIGARGSRSQFASKLLVMIDGRSVYTPVFGGVFWDVQDYLLADLDHIEVVLGPGGSIWGANAVNGVVNILTRSAHETLGDRVSVTIGHGEESTELRHGWLLNEQTAGRVYAKFTADDGTRLPTGGSAEDAVRIGRIGFRFDHEDSAATNWTFSGEAYRGDNDLTVTLPTLTAPPAYQVTDRSGEQVQGGNLLARWDGAIGAESTLRLGAWFDTDARHGAIFDFVSNRAQVDLQESLTLGTRHAIDWGASARYTEVHTRNRWIAFDHDQHHVAQWSGFAQDEFTLIPNQLKLTAGIKLEHNNFTGFEPQPSVKLAWFPTRQYTLWAGWSRAVRIPAITENSNITDAVVLPPGVRDPLLPTALRGLGNPALDAETLNALDAGWRWAPQPTWTVSASVFLNRYEQLIKVTNAPPIIQSASVPALIIPLPEDNGMSLRSTGGELAVTWQALPTWRLNLSLAEVNPETQVTTPDPIKFVNSLRNIPHWTAMIGSVLQLGAHWELTAAIRWIDDVPSLQIAHYTEASAQLAWRPQPAWELALVGRNLFDPQHLENRPGLAGPSVEIPRRVELRISWKQ